MFGLNEGKFASARISPVQGSMMTADPAEAPLDSHAGAQLALGDVLQILIDRQLERRTGGRRPLHAAERVPPRIGLDQDRAGLAPDERVVRPLDAAETDVVHPDIAEHVRDSSRLG